MARKVVSNDGDEVIAEVNARDQTETLLRKYLRPDHKLGYAGWKIDACILELRGNLWELGASEYQRLTSQNCCEIVSLYSDWPFYQKRRRIKSERRSDYFISKSIVDSHGNEKNAMP